MALLEDQIEEAQAAFLAAHEAKDIAGAQALADHVRGLQAQKAEVDKAATESSQEGTNLRNPLMAAGAGAVIGAAANPARSAVHNIITPPAAPPKMSAPPPSSLSGQLGQGGENWTKSLTGVDVPNAQMNKGSLDTAQRMAATVGRGGELAGGRITEGGIMLGPEVGAKPAAPAPRTMASQTKQAGKSLLQGIAGEPQPTSPFSVVKGGARGALTGAALADIPQQLEQGNYGTAAADTGIGVGNIIHGLAKTKKGKAIGTLLGLGSGVTRSVQGVNELMPEEKAEGGLVHLAGGGLANALTQTAINTPLTIAPSAASMTKNAGRGAYAPAIEDAAELALAMAPLNPLTAALSFMVPSEAGAGSTRVDWEKQKAAEAAARQRAQKQFEQEEFMRTRVGVNAPKFLQQYEAQKARNIPKFSAGKEVLKGLSKNIKLPSQTFSAAPEQTVTDPLRNAFPGIYKRPDVIAAEAAARVAPEGDAMKRLFGVTRDDLYEMGKGRVGNQAGLLPGAAANPKGSKAATAVMNPRNEQRLLDVLSEAEKHPALVRGMDPWYIMDPAYKRLEELVGPEEAVRKYRQLNTLTGMASPGSDVLTEMNRGTAANFLATQGRFNDFINYGGKQGKPGTPPDMSSVLGHPYHPTAQAFPMKQYLDTGEIQMSSPKVPAYIQASGVPQTGFQTDLPVGDAHWSRAVGLADTRGAATRKGQSVVPGASVSNPEMSTLAPWWKDKIAGQVGLESVPAQARAWGAFSPQTGVESPIGAPKLELLSMKIMEAADRYGVSPEQARDMILKGEGYAGKKEGGPIDSYAPGGKVGAAKKLFEEAQAAYKAKFTPGFYHGSPSNKIKEFDSTRNADPYKLETPGVTFVTRDPDFAESFLPMKMTKPEYETGATMYPVSVNLGKHWHPGTPEGKQVIADYMKSGAEKSTLDTLPNIKKGLRQGNWSYIEDPNFLEHLQNTGHETFHVMEGGIPNVGIFDSKNIRGKFAKFNPEHAESPDFMKAAGGAVEGYAPGGKVFGALTELMQLVKQQGGLNAAQRLERAADLVPNLENKFQPQALKSAFTGDNATAMMVMKPSDFQKYATPLPESHKNWNQFNITDQNRKGNYQDYLDYLGRVSNQGGFSSVPYLQLNQEKGMSFPNIAGHEGRNRSDALAKLGDQSSLVQMMPRAGLREQFPRRSQEEYLNALQGELGSYPMVTVQPDWDPVKEKWIHRGLRDLPELFKKGGKV